MRIAFVTDTYEEGIAGGVVTAVRFVEALRRRHEVTVLATGRPAPGKVVLPGFQLPLRLMWDNRITFGWPSPGTLRRIFARVDVVHLNFPFLLCFGAARIARRMGVPTVAALHVQAENVFLSLGIHSQWPSRLLYRHWVRDFFNRADAVVCPSSFGMERLRSFGLTVPAVVVSNGAPARRLNKPVRTGDRKPTILCLGRLSREKRQDVIIDAVARCRHRDSVELVIAGAGPRERQLREHARRLGLPVQFGYVTEERLTELLAEATLFVHASEAELEGMAVLEAITAGLPVLIADAPHSAARQFASRPEFLFRPGDADDLAARLDYLLDSPEALAEGRRCSLECSKHYDFQRSVLLLEQLYAAVAAGRHAPAAVREPKRVEERQGAT